MYKRQVVDGCDNFSTRYLISDSCSALHKPYVYGAIPVSYTHHIMFNGTDEDLRQTKVTQPAVFLHYVISALCMGDDFKPEMTAGHSLGEFSEMCIRDRYYGDKQFAYNQTDTCTSLFHALVRAVP